MAAVQLEGRALEQSGGSAWAQQLLNDSQAAGMQHRVSCGMARSLHTRAAGSAPALRAQQQHAGHGAAGYIYESTGVQTNKIQCPGRGIAAARVGEESQAAGESSSHHQGGHRDVVFGRQEGHSGKSVRASKSREVAS
eukprot:jgi/Ulvmu1/11480/UM077_0024.1